MICVLDSNLNTLGVLDVGSPDGTPFFNDILHVADDGTQELDFSMPVNSSVSDYMKEETFIMYKATYGTQYLMRIISIDESTLDGERVRVVHAENSAIGELSRTLIRPNNNVNPDAATTINYSLKGFLTSVLQYTDYKMGVVAVDGATTSYAMDVGNYTNVYARIQDALKQWNCAAEYVVQMEGFRVVGKQINLYSKVLNDEPEKVFTYSVDLVGAKRTIMGEQIINGVCVVGKGDEKSGQRKTLRGQTVTIPTQYQPDFAVHPTYPDVIYSKTAFQMYGSGKLQVGLLDLPEVTSVSDMTLKACVELAAKMKPQVQYEVKVETIKEWTGFEEDKAVNIGDTIIVLDDSFNPALRVSARCIEKYSSWSTPENNYVVFGDYKEITTDPKVIFKKQTNLVNNYSTLWKDASSRVQSGVAASGDSTGIQLNTLDINADIGDENVKIIYISNQNTDPQVNMVKMSANTIKAEGANGVVIATSIEDIDGYNPASGEIEVSSGVQMADVLSKMPKYIYRRIVIRFKANITGNFVLEGFHGGGELVIAQDDFNLTGSYAFLRCACRVGCSSGVGKVQGLASGTVVGNYTLNAMVNVIGCPEVEIFGLEIYGGSGSTYSDQGVYIAQSNCLISSTNIFNVNECIVTKASQVYISNCTGKARSGFGLNAGTGTLITGTGTCPQGSGGTNEAAAVSLSGGSQKFVTFTYSSGTNDGSTNTSTTKRVANSSSKSWDTQYGWKTSPDVTQGKWNGYGHNRGCWFFGTSLSSVLAGKTITSMKIYVTRKSGAGYQSAPVRIYAHTMGAYTDSAGDPLGSFIYTGANVSVTMAQGESRWIDVTALASRFASNGAKGFAVYTSSTADTEYGKFNTDLTVEVTYS